MFERFTESARQVVVRAQDEARVLEHSHIGSGHLLLGLLAEKDHIPARVLSSFGVTAGQVRERVMEIVKRGEIPAGGQIPFTPCAKKVLSLSLQEAMLRKHNTITPAHILLGLVRAGEAGAMQILRDSGVDATAIRGAVLPLLLGPDPPAISF